MSQPKVQPQQLISPENNANLQKPLPNNNAFVLLKQQNTFQNNEKSILYNAPKQ